MDFGRMDLFGSPWISPFALSLPAPPSDANTAGLQHNVDMSEGEKKNDSQKDAQPFQVPAIPAEMMMDDHLQFLEETGLRIATQQALSMSDAAVKFAPDETPPAKRRCVGSSAEKEPVAEPKKDAEPENNTATEKAEPENEQMEKHRKSIRVLGQLLANQPHISPAALLKEIENEDA